MFEGVYTAKHAATSCPTCPLQQHQNLEESGAMLANRSKMELARAARRAMGERARARVRTMRVEEAQPCLGRQGP
eukprot:4523719-Pyramimonas_sp.AAC.1